MRRYTEAPGVLRLKRDAERQRIKRVSPFLAVPVVVKPKAKKPAPEQQALF